jgi:DNA-binding IclR family transcriptional regulator
MQERQTKVKSLGRAIDIVDAIIELDSPSLTAISDKTKIPDSTVHRYLSALQQEGYIVCNGDEYELGLQFLRTGRLTQMKRKEYQLAKPITENIAEQTGERAQFAVAEHDCVFGVHMASGERAVETDNYIGKPNPMYATSTGKAILAQWDEGKILDLVDSRGLHSLTENTITDVDELLEELEEIKETGISFNWEENTEGLHAVAVPVNGSDGVIGALNVSGPAHRLRSNQFEEEMPDLLLGSANELELRIKYSE